jgi:hypothetical protein
LEAASVSLSASSFATGTTRTLDLAEHGGLAINGVLGSCDPDPNFENYFLTFIDTAPAYMVHFGSQVSGVLPKYVEALPLLRLMTGSDELREVEDAMLAAVLQNCSDDGLIYDRTTSDRPWNAGVGYGVAGWNEDYANLAGNGRLLGGVPLLPSVGSANTGRTSTTTSGTACWKSRQPTWTSCDGCPTLGRSDRRMPLGAVMTI